MYIYELEFIHLQRYCYINGNSIHVYVCMMCMYSCPWCQVLPRQTCGLFTHTIKMADFPGGAQALTTSIQGGELFQTFINTPVSSLYGDSFMTYITFFGLPCSQIHCTKSNSVLLLLLTIIVVYQCVTSIFNS